MESALTEEDKQIVYNWIDEVPLSKPKKNINRDFSDAVLLAEVIKHFQPKLVDIHNYSAFNSVTQKKNNWDIINKKVLKKLGLQLSKIDIDNLVNAIPDAIEKVLKAVKIRLEVYKPKVEEISSYGMKPSAPTVPNTAPLVYSDKIDNDILTEKEITIQELKETIEIMEVKIKKLEQLIRLKDSKIQALSNMLAQNGITEEDAKIK